MALDAAHLFLLASGLILLGGELQHIPKIGEDLEQVAAWLRGFGVFIGIVDILLVFLAVF